MSVLICKPDDLVLNRRTGGAVEVTISGKKEITSIKFDPEVVDPDDIEMLEDLTMAAVNEAIRKIEEVSAQKMSKITGGMGGLF